MDNIPEMIEKMLNDYVKQCNKPGDANEKARILSEIMIHGFGSRQEFPFQWIQLANYFFAVLPGIISLFLFVQRYSMTEEELVNEKIRSFRGIATSFVLAGVLAPIIITIFQIAYFDRLIFIKITHPVLLGQIVSIIMWFLTSSRPVLKWFNNGLGMAHIIPAFVIVILLTLYLMLYNGLNKIVAIIIMIVGSVLMIMSAIPTFRWRKLTRIGLFMACMAIMVFLVYIRLLIPNDNNEAPSFRTKCRDKWKEDWSWLSSDAITIPLFLV